MDPNTGMNAKIKELLGKACFIKVPKNKCNIMIKNAIKTISNRVTAK